MSDDIWKRRFLLYMVVRLIGLALFLLGIAIAYSNLVRPGGFPQLGAVLAIIGAVGGMFAPRLLTKRWRREDS
jgi:hypothetical protein